MEVKAPTSTSSKCIAIIESTQTDTTSNTISTVHDALTTKWVVYIITALYLLTSDGIDF